ncbi:MAG: hypothetical protein KF861_10595 [Planctomycetaceae bacterium]|nr:hypothetical protein [Planctomycetaceae bacterium]
MCRPAQRNSSFAWVFCIAALLLGHGSLMPADDTPSAAPRAPLTRTHPMRVSSLTLVPSEPTPAAPAANVPNDISQPAVPLPAAVCTPLPPDPSYTEISDQYPAPAQTLVPPALRTGPQYRGLGTYGTAYGEGVHIRFPYYNYRSPWTYGGPASVNHTIHW